jgi:hypothetical protein
VLIAIIVVSTIVTAVSAATVTVSFSRVPMRLRLKMLVVMRIIPGLIPPVRIVTVIMDLFKIMFSDAIGNMLIRYIYPRAVVIGGGIPDIAVVQIIDVPGIEQIAADADSHVEAKLRRIKKEWRLGNNHWRVDISNWSTSNVYAYIDSYI